MRLRSFLVATPWWVIGFLTAFSLVSAWLLRNVQFTLSGPPGEKAVIVGGEVLCAIYTICVVTLVAPSMPEFDLRRRRAQKAAVVRSTLALLSVILLAWFTVKQLDIAYANQSGTTSTEPESELIINNSVVVFGIASIAVTLLGRLRGIATTLVLWILGFLPLVFNHNALLWPFDHLQGPGPWFSLPHVAASTTLVALALLLQYRTAGIGARALAAERTG